MKKNIKLPAPQLSVLKEVNLELDMTGRHYSTLATCQGQSPETVVLSILRDLLDEDANKLTMSELRYLFMLVKINNLENNFNAIVTCTHENDGKPCKHQNTFPIKLSDADLNPTPSDYKVPEIKFKTKIDGEVVENEYLIIPPQIDMEIALTDWFLTEKGCTFEEITEDKELSLEYTFIRGVMHLVDKEGNRVVTNPNQFPEVLTCLDINKFNTVTQLTADCIEVDSYGVKNKVYSFKCKECGGTLVFQLPLLYGLADW